MSTLFKNHVDFILDGSGSPGRSQERRELLHQVLQNTRLHVLLRRFHNYHGRVVDVHTPRLRIANVGDIPSVPLIPRHNHDLRSVTAHHWRNSAK